MNPSQQAGAQPKAATTTARPMQTPEARDRADQETAEEATLEPDEMMAVDFFQHDYMAELPCTYAKGIVTSAERKPL